MVWLAGAEPAEFERALTAIAPVRAGLPPEVLSQLLDALRADALRVCLLSALSVALLIQLQLRRRAAAWALVLLAAGDVFASGQRFLQTAPGAAFEWPPALVEECRRIAGPGGRVLATPELRAPNTPARYDLGSLVGYDTFMDGRYARFINRASEAPLDRFISFVQSAGDAPLLRHLSPSVVLTTLPLVDSAGHASLGIGKFHRIGGAGPLQVLAADDPEGRVAVVHSAEIVPDEEEAYRRMETVDFDIRKPALLDVPCPARLEAPIEGRSERVRIARYEPNLVVIEVEAASAGLVVLSDAYEVGWAAEVDGSPAWIGAANRVMRAVAVPAGRHTIAMRYEAPGFKTGVWLSALGLACVFAIGVFERRRAVAPRREEQTESNRG
jgi:hypothetical protein